MATGQINLDVLLGTSRYDAIMRAELAAIAAHQATLAEEIERRQQAVLAADREVRMLEKLRDKQRELHQAGQALAEMKELDEIAARQSWRHANDPDEAQGFQEATAVIGKLVKSLGGFGVYACVATLLAQLMAVGYLMASGRLDGQRVDQILSAARGETQPLAQPHEVTPQAEVEQEQPSYEDRERARQLASRQLEMREQALEGQLGATPLRTR